MWCGWNAHSVGQRETHLERQVGRTVRKFPFEKQKCDVSDQTRGSHDPAVQKVTASGGLKHTQEHDVRYGDTAAVLKGIQLKT